MRLILTNGNPLNAILVPWQIGFSKPREHNSILKSSHAYDLSKLTGTGICLLNPSSFRRDKTPWAQKAPPNGLLLRRAHYLHQRARLAGFHRIGISRQTASGYRLADTYLWKQSPGRSVYPQVLPLMRTFLRSRTTRLGSLPSCIRVAM